MCGVGWLVGYHRRGNLIVRQVIPRYFFVNTLIERVLLLNISVNLFLKIMKKISFKLEENNKTEKAGNLMGSFDRRKFVRKTFALLGAGAFAKFATGCKSDSEGGPDNRSNEAMKNLIIDYAQNTLPTKNFSTLNLAFEDLSKFIETEVQKNPQRTSKFIGSMHNTGGGKVDKVNILVSNVDTNSCATKTVSKYLAAGMFEHEIKCKS